MKFVKKILQNYRPDCDIDIIYEAFKMYVKMFANVVICSVCLTLTILEMLHFTNSQALILLIQPVEA